MRISDWSSDVCSSDLRLAKAAQLSPTRGEGKILILRRKSPLPSRKREGPAKREGEGAPATSATLAALPYRLRSSCFRVQPGRPSAGSRDGTRPARRDGVAARTIGTRPGRGREGQ